MDVSAAEKARLLAEIVFDEILGSQTKVRHRDTKSDYPNSTACSTARPGARPAMPSSFEVLTPLGDDYDKLHSAKSSCGSRGAGRAIVRLPEGDRLDIELATYQQIEKYIVSPKADQALHRSNASWPTAGRTANAASASYQLSNSSPQATSPQASRCRSRPAARLYVLDLSCSTASSPAPSKLPYLKVRQADPIAEIKAVLSAGDLAQHALALNGEAGNPLAVQNCATICNWPPASPACCCPTW